MNYQMDEMTRCKTMYRSVSIFAVLWFVSIMFVESAFAFLMSIVVLALSYIVMFFFTKHCVKNFENRKH